MYSEFFNDQIIDSIQVLLSMVQGRLVENKDQLMKSTFLDNMAQLWEASKDFPFEETKNRYQQDKKIEYFLNLIGIGYSKIIENAFTEQNINLIKKYMLEVFEHLIESDINGERKRQIIRRLTYKNLQRYFVDLFKVFKVKYNRFYSSHSQEFLKYGFKIFLLLQDHEESQRNLQQALVIQARQIMDQKNKSLIKTDEEIREEELICLFAEAYQFFEQNTGHIIIVNEQINEIQTIYFPYYPHCNRSNSIIESEINQKIDRFSFETKLSSFMGLAEEYNQRLHVEQSFQDKSIKVKMFKVLIFFFKNLEFFRMLNFFIGISINIYLLLKYQGVNGSSFFNKIRSGNLDDFINTTIAILFVFDLIILLFSILQMQKYYSWKIQQDIKHKQYQKKQKLNSQYGSVKSSNASRQIKKEQQFSSISHNLNKLDIPLLKFEIIIIYIQNWLSSNTISYVVLYTPILLLTMLFNEFFASLLLFDIFFKFPETQNILQVLWSMKKRIISTIILYLILIYFFSLLAFLVTPLNNIYHDICENFLSCFSILLDSTLRSVVSSSPIYDPIYEKYNDSFSLGYENIYLFFYVFFVISLIWTWSFTAYFIDAYGLLRQKNDAYINDTQNICLICRMDRKQISQICPEGFDYHIQVFFQYSLNLYQLFIQNRKYITNGTIQSIFLSSSLKAEKNLQAQRVMFLKNGNRETQAGSQIANSKFTFLQNI